MTKSEISTSPSLTVDAPRVLVVDDDADALEECKQALNDLGLSALVTTDARAALLLLSVEKQIGAVVTDLRMPGMDGLSFISEVQRLFQSNSCPQFILISGHGTVDTAIAAIRLDVVDFLRKPIDRDDLIRAVVRAFSRFEARVSPEYRAGPDGAPSKIASSGTGELAHGDHLKVLKSIRARKRRNDILGGDLFSDPAWGMLLELYLAALERRLLSVTSLCFASGAPNTTALRRIEDLAASGLVERAMDKNDRRRTHIFLSPSGFDRMSKLFREMQSIDGYL